jgi:hypothetical protein
MGSEARPRDEGSGSAVTTSSGSSPKAADDVIRFEIRDGIRRVSFVVSNEALEAASGLPGLSSAMLRRRSFDRFRTLIHAAAARRLASLPLGFVSPVVLTGRDLRAVPTERGTPAFGSSGRTPARPAADEPQAAPDASRDVL